MLMILTGVRTSNKFKAIETMLFVYIDSKVNEIKVL